MLIWILFSINALGAAITACKFMYAQTLKPDYDVYSAAGCLLGTLLIGSLHAYVGYWIYTHA